MAEAVAINSAGTLVGAVLESAGYIYQSHILDTLSKPLTNEIGALVYLVGIVTVILQLVVFKSSKMAPWLLIGPAIFFVVINDRDTISYAKWSFGSNERDFSKVQSGVNNVVEGGATSPRVSKVFKRYVEVVSATTRSIVDTISGLQKENDLWMMAKGGLYGTMTAIQQDDPGLKLLIQNGLLDQCYLAVQAAKAVDDPTKRTVSPNVIKGIVDAAFRYFSPRAILARADYNRLVNEARIVNFSQRDAVLNYIAKKEGLSGDALEKRKGELASYQFTCNEIWEFALRGILDKAEEYHEGLESQSEKLGIDKSAITNLLSQASGQSSKSKLLSTGGFSAAQAQQVVKVIAKFYLRNETRNADISARISGFVGRNDVRKIGVSGQGSNAFTEQSRIGASEWAEKDRLATASHAMPTFQGLALYFLGVAFPFFALLLLIPGKATGFLLWFMLWLWIKSWDIALAVVAQLDTIFWSIYAVQKTNLGQEDSLPTDFAAAIVSLEQMDPTFQMTGYYLLLATCVLAIPTVMAQFILGSMRGGASILAAGINKFADFYSEGTLIRTEQAIINQLKSDAIELKELRGMAFAYNGPLRSQILEGRDNSYTVTPEAVASPSGDARGRIGESPTGGAVSDPNTLLFGNNPVSGLIYNRKQPLAVNITSLLQNYSNFAGRIAHSSGIASPLRPLKTNNEGLLDDATKIATSADRNYFPKIKDAGLNVLQTQLKAGATHAAFESDIEKRAYELHEQIAILRGIPVPWTSNGTEGSADEFKRHQSVFDEQISLIQGMLEGAEETTGIGLNGGTKSFLSVPIGVAAHQFLGNLTPVLKESIAEKHGLLAEGDTEEQINQKLFVHFSENYTVSDLLRGADDLSTVREGRSNEEIYFTDTEFGILDEPLDRERRYMQNPSNRSRRRVLPTYALDED